MSCSARTNPTHFPFAASTADAVVRVFTAMMSPALPPDAATDRSAWAKSAGAMCSSVEVGVLADAAPADLNVNFLYCCFESKHSANLYSNANSQPTSHIHRRRRTATTAQRHCHPLFGSGAAAFLHGLAVFEEVLGEAAGGQVRSY